jgi:pyrimidine-specific ribonucleoside hydrolase
MDCSSGKKDEMEQIAHPNRKMKRKSLVVAGIILGILSLCILLIWPAAPLGKRLGLPPVCLQGDWPHLKIVSCPDSTEELPVSVPRPLPTPVGKVPIPLIVDDDGSPDGMIALLYFLKNPLFDVRAVTVSCGEAHPEIFARHLQRLLAGLGRTAIPVGIGRSMPLEGNNVFPAPWRQASDDFWGIKYPQGSVSKEPEPAAELIVETINNSTNPVMVFLSGTHTNLAEALRHDPGIAKNIRAVQVMGGAIHIPGNIKSDWPEIDNEVAEWNIWVDPAAAAVVFASGLPIHLVPLDATNQVPWSRTDAQSWISSGSPENILAGKLLQWMLDAWSVKHAYLWDLVAALNATDLSLCPQVQLAVEVRVTPGPDQGQTVVSDPGHPIRACLDPDPEQMKSLAAAVLGR